MNKIFWESYASGFDAIYGTRNNFYNSIVNSTFRKAMKLRYDKTILNITGDNVSVIDIGCGPGHYCFALAESDKRDITGIDFSENMIKIAQRHANDQNLSDRINFKVVDFFDFEPERKFDYSIMMGFVEYFENPEIIIAKAVSITSRKVFMSLPVAGGILGLQRKIRYKRKCFLKMYTEQEVKDLMFNLDISSYTIEKLSRDFYISIDII